MLPVEFNHGVADIWLFRPFPGLLVLGFICKHGLLSSYLFVLREACPSFVLLLAASASDGPCCCGDDPGVFAPQSADHVAAVVRLEGLQVAFCQG